MQGEERYWSKATERAVANPRPYQIVGVITVGPHKGSFIRTAAAEWNTSQEEARRRRQRERLDAKREGLMCPVHLPPPPGE